MAKAELALRGLERNDVATWIALRPRGIFRGSGAPGKVAFLFTGQGSQYANMLRDLRSSEPIVAEVFDEADAIMAPLLEGRRLSDIVFADPADAAAVARAEEELRRTEITQPAVLTVDAALTRLLGAYGIAPDLVMGHSLGEYGALVAAGALSFEAALEAVSARGREMASLKVPDPGAMAAVMAPLDEVESGRRRHRRLRRAGQRQLHAPGRARRRDRGGRPRGRRARGARPRCAAASRQPRLPHLDRGARERAAAGDARAARRARRR